MGLLIGLNCPSALHPREVVYGEESKPYAIHSLLGWYINGPLSSSQQSDSITCNRICLNQEDTFAAPRGYVVPQRTVKEQIIPQAVKQMFEKTKRGQLCLVKTSSSMTQLKEGSST